MTQNRAEAKALGRTRGMPASASALHVQGEILGLDPEPTPQRMRLWESRSGDKHILLLGGTRVTVAEAGLGQGRLSTWPQPDLLSPRAFPRGPGDSSH